MQFSSVEHKKAENQKSLKGTKSDLIIVRGLKKQIHSSAPKKEMGDDNLFFGFYFKCFGIH